MRAAMGYRRLFFTWFWKDFCSLGGEGLAGSPGKMVRPFQVGGGCLVGKWKDRSLLPVRGGGGVHHRLQWKDQMFSYALTRGSGTMVSGYHGTMVAWYHGTMVPWYHGTMVPYGMFSKQSQLICETTANHSLNKNLHNLTLMAPF